MDDSSQPRSAIAGSALIGHALRFAESAAFEPPHFGFSAVPTRAIAMALQREPFPRLVTACAPPGYGKSVMLSTVHQALKSRGWTCLWLTLDDRDSTLSTLLHRLCGAMKHAGIDGVPDVSALGGQFTDRSAAADAVLSVLTRLVSPVALFLDNLGFCQDPALGHFLQRLLFQNRSPLHLVLSSTLDIPLDLASAKLQLDTLELNTAHLRFDLDGTASLLRQAGVDSANQRQLDRILAHTEGWPAAVRLLQVLLLGEMDGTSPGDGSQKLDLEPVLAQFSGDQNDVARVLTRRVLVDFDPDLVHFMMEIALVREFSVELAADMTGREQASPWLQELVARNVLIFPLDRSRRWFRFHTLLREFLQAEGRERLVPERRRAVLERAAHWHLRHGDKEAAISIALDGGWTALAQQLLDGVAHVVVGDRGQMSQLIQWVDKLMAAGAVPSPEVHAWFVWALCDSLQYERARRALNDLDARAAGDESFWAGLRGAGQRMLFLRMLVNVWLDRFDTAHAQAQAWLSGDIGTDALTLSTVVSIAGIAEIDRGTLIAARSRMDSASAIIGRSESAYGWAWVAILQACVEIGQARPNAAEALLADVRERVVRAIGPDASVVLTMDFVHARVLLEQGRAEAARPLAQRSLGHAAQHGIMVTVEQGLIACVALWNGSQDEDGGISERMLDRVAHSYPPRARLLLAAAKSRRLIQLGRMQEAEAIINACGLNAPHQTMRERADWLLVQIELQLARRASHVALQRVEALAKAAREDGRYRDEIELHLLASRIHLRLQDRRLALRSLGAAITLAAPGNAIHPLVQQKALVDKLLSESGPRMLGMLQDAEFALVRRLELDPAFALTEPDVAADGAGGGVDEPTAREIQLLKLLNQGLSNAQVAGQLSLSVSTVKWHMHNLYVKLGVRSRSAALARARSRKLIPPS